MTHGVYRSVKLVLDNRTGETLTVQGVAVLTGQWTDPAPKQGHLVAAQSSAEWMSVSRTLGRGTSASVRFGSSQGHPMVRWSLPWTGRFEFTAEDTPGLRVNLSVDDSEPNAVVLLATMQDRQPQERGRTQ